MAECVATSREDEYINEEIEWTAVNSDMYQVLRADREYPHLDDEMCCLCLWV